MEHILLVDSDSIVFQAAAVAEKAEVPIFKKDNIMNRAIKAKMDKITHSFFFADMKVAMRGNANFRKTIYPEYKANRPDLSQLLSDLINEGTEMMANTWDAVAADGMEADDLVSIWAYEEYTEGSKTPIIVGIDKDLKQIPGNHYNFNNYKREFISQDEAHLLLMKQCLTGDAGDNIPGIRGIGPEKASTILETVPAGSRWDVVKRTWREHEAGDPWLSYTLLSMLKSWDEYTGIKKKVMEINLDNFGTFVPNKTPQREQNVCKEGEDNL